MEEIKEVLKVTQSSVDTLQQDTIDKEQWSRLNNVEIKGVPVRNDQLLNYCSKLESITSNNDSDKFLVLGDFNMSCIDWNTECDGDGLEASVVPTEHISYFLDTIHFCNLQQFNHIGREAAQLRSSHAHRCQIDITKQKQNKLKKTKQDLTITCDALLMPTQHCPTKPTELRVNYATYWKRLRQIAGAPTEKCDLLAPTGLWTPRAIYNLQQKS
ncbi:unnamed protein product [Plutella xylostella]|uniref:(diamondback moth) hypothetical protein n=1 Tax=Plutella xylostella TaxID=51655 RepID=A0A8S4EYW2_PLUXY|nr:unnamed protein product [Plutella xylostella]